MGRFAAAEKMTHHALVGLGTALGATHPHTLRTSKRLASYIRFQGRIDEAEPLLERALEHQKKIFGNVHPEPISTLSSLAMVRLAQQRFRKAEEMLQSVLDFYEAIFDESHPRIHWVKKKLQDLHEHYAKEMESEFVPASEPDDSLLEMVQQPIRPSQVELQHEKEHYDYSGFGREEDFPRKNVILEELKNNEQKDDVEAGKLLRLAAAGGRLNLLKEIIRFGVNVNVEEGYWGTPLQAASCAGASEVVKFLLKQPDIDVKMRGTDVR